jgi:hypothetical protein
MRRTLRRPRAVAGGLPPGEAAALLDTLTAGYQRAQDAAERACSPTERRARQDLARDLRRLARHERAASHHIAERAEARQSGRSVSFGALQAAREPRDREAGE